MKNLGFTPWVGSIAMATCCFALAIIPPASAAIPTLTLVGPDAAGEYDLTWSSGVLQQEAAWVGAQWADVGIMGNSYHIAPASDVGHNKFYRVRDGQSYSANIIGYINLTIPTGFSMIANQLNAVPDNTLGTVLASVPENTTVYKFIPAPAPGHYQSSNFSADNPGWTVPKITLNPGEGVFISIDPAQIAPATTYAATFVGEVQFASTVPVTNGCSIVSSAVPVSDTLNNLGFPARENDTVYRYDGTLNNNHGGFRTYNWSADNPGWAPSPPIPNVGEAFFVCGLLSRTWSRAFAVGPP